MNGPSTNPENELSSTLQRQADQFARRGGHDLDITQVVSRAGEIRRGRRMRATMVMAAVVLAVAVPVGATVIGSDPTKPKDVVPAVQPDTSAISLADLEIGDEPKTGYVLGRQLHDGSGTTIGLKEAVDPMEASAVEIARIAGGYLVKRVDEDYNLEVSFLGVNRAAPTQTWRATFGIAVSPEENVGAFVQPDGTVIAIQDGGDTAVELGQAPGQLPKGQGSQSLNSFEIGGMTGEDCRPGGDCTVYVLSTAAPQKVWAVTPDSVTQVHPGFRGVAGIAPDGTIAGQVSSSDDGSCSEVRAVDDTVLATTCGYRFHAFAPDGQHLLAAQAYGDGAGDGQLAVLDPKTLEPVLDLRTAGDATVYRAIWEDDDHVLAIVQEKGRWAAIRFSLNGAREYALAPMASGADDVRAPFVLPER